MNINRYKAGVTRRMPLEEEIRMKAGLGGMEAK